MDAWPFFPDIKVGKTYLYFSFFGLFGVVNYESLDSTDFDFSYNELGILTATVFSCRFCFLSQSSFVERLQIRLVFFHLTTLSVDKQLN